MQTPVLIYLPAPVGWIALTPEALREAQARAAEALGVEKVSDERIPRAEGADCVTAEQAARSLGVQASWLLRQARERRIPFLKVGKFVRFDVDALRQHLAKGPNS